MSPSTVPLMLAPLGVSIVLSLTGTRLGSQLPPATAVRLLTVAALVTALSTGFVLAVAGFVAIAQLPPVAALGAWSAPGVRAVEAFPPALGAMSAVVSAILMVLALRRVVEASRDLAAAEVACRRLGIGADGLVIVNDDAPDAFALPGLRGRVVVSTGMLRALPAPERRVLLAHEAAHLRHRHHLYMQLVELSAAANPLLRPLTPAVRRAVERWADEEAAGLVGDRTVVARAVARASLAARQPTSPAPTGDRARLAMRTTESMVLSRTRAMLAPAPGSRRVLAAAVTALMFAGAAGAVATGQHTEHLFEVARSAFSQST